MPIPSRMDVETRRRRPRVRWPFIVALGIALCGLGVRKYRYDPNAELLNDAYYVQLHAWQYGQLTRLGQPPQARALYDAWLANFRRRALLETQALALEEQRQQAAFNRVAASLDRFKAEGNLVGQEFGLVRCTSNGDRTPVPILKDGQPLPLP